MTEIVIVDGARTPFGTFGGALKDVNAIDLAVIAAKEALNRANIDASEVDETIVGNVIQSSGDAVFLARHVGLKTGVRQEVPGLTVNRLCGSGLQAIISAAQSIELGVNKVVLAGGTENMSQIPHVIRDARWGIPLGKTTMQDYLWESLYDPIGDCTMSITAENLAKKYEISREEVDRFAKLSQDRAQRAIEKGIFAEEIVPVETKQKKAIVTVSKDEHPRNVTMEQLQKLPARFIENGVVTPGNASGINDGAAMLVVTTADYAKERGLKPIARLVSYDIVGVDPTIMGIGPVPAILGALEKASLSIKDLDLIEINEAFASQYLACQKELDFPEEIGNVNGGAIALGHPLGASGARLALTAAYELKRRGGKYGATALCIGGGQGIAAIWEAL
ncbi:MAG TPA: acetyl-CoA C-acetyltransferase [Ureibacillus sp.]|nr:acetyl-CoA C-acetyltransferase [Ureibacillus sp.]